MRPGPVSWRHSLVTMAAAAYAPYVAMFFYTFAFDPNVRLPVGTAAALLAASPGLIGTHLLLTWTGLGRQPDGIEFAAAGVMAAAFVVSIAAIGRFGRGWLAGAATAAFLAGAVGAWVLLMLLRA